MFHKVVAAYNESPEAERALISAIKLTKIMNGELASHHRNGGPSRLHCIRRRSRSLSTARAETRSRDVLSALTREGPCTRSVPWG